MEARLLMEHTGLQQSFIQDLKEILDKSLEGAVISDMRIDDQPLIYCNDTFLEMTGYSRDEVLGTNCRFLQQNDRQQEGLKTLSAAIKNSKSCKIVLRNYKKSGELFYNRLSISPITDSAGKLTHYLGIQDDITDIIALDRKLSEAEKEREVLLSEVHHRVKNNLAVMSSLMELERSAGHEQDMLEKSMLRINSMAMIHERLYQKEGLAYLNFADFIKELTESELVEGNRAKVTLDHKLEAVELNLNQAVPLSIIVCELVQNSCRHAYPDQSEGKVIIELTEAPNGNVDLEIIDFGTGLPETVDFFGSGTIGFTIINTLLMQVGGEAELIEDGNVGFGVKITFQKSDDPGSSQKFRIRKTVSAHPARLYQVR